MEHIVFQTVATLDHPDVQSLWERQRAYHGQLASPFAAEVGARVYADRCAELLAKAQQGHFRVELAQDAATEACIGYCITTVTAQAAGEIDSLFVDEAYRGQGIGDALLQRALVWMDELDVRVKRISVAGGNEAVLGFYQRHGFYARSHVLMQVANGGKQE
ncbi:MAG TPA: GNAT family N-acetyltransferase [Armatimonadota bacterium]|jgi:ribosomal protein S18 acetylase RimI-like enzyme